ncbi:MAG: hypothetical protein AAF065_13395 [Verrucomicrobiota bacterium]
MRIPIYNGSEGKVKLNPFFQTPATAGLYAKFKYVRNYQPEREGELFDFEADISEQNNLAKSHPEILSEMSKQMDKWLKDNHAALPRPLKISILEMSKFPESVKLNLPSLLLAALIAASPTIGAQHPNLVPDSPVNSANYWCTWYAQNYWIQRGGEINSLGKITNPAAREHMTYHNLFNPTDGWASTYLPRGREDYIFLIDHGWQTKDKAEFFGGGRAFFNSVADPGDFPPYKGMNPPELLKKFNEEIQAQGWNSLGLWFRGDIKKEEARTFVEWSKEAGITYWKVDGGDTGSFHCFKVKEEIYPELQIEYATPAGNLNPNWDKEQPSYPSPYVAGRIRDRMMKILQYSDTFRTYDAPPLLMTSVSIRRVHDILRQTQQQPKYRALINFQDDCNAAIGLGVVVASKRHPNYGERLMEGKDLHHQLSGPRRMQKRINEVERFGRWSRIAPAFPAGEGVYLSSDDELIDRCVFTKWDTWNKATYGKMVSQSAPAIMARNMPLPEVECNGIRPYVFTSTYPNGPTGIATEGRVTPENKWLEPRAKVTVKIKDATQLIGIAGHYDELILEFADSIEDVQHVWAQDLLAERASNIKNRVTIKGRTLRIPGELIDTMGTSAGDEGDISAPGMVLKLDGKNLPVAGEDFTPVVQPVNLSTSARTKPIKSSGGKPSTKGTKTYADGFSGAAGLEKTSYGYRVTASGPQQIVLRKLNPGRNAGKFSVTWKMKAADSSNSRNGFLVLSSHGDTNAALLAGSWIGGNKMALFEGGGKWSRSPNKDISSSDELECRLDVDIDLRTAALTIDGMTQKLAFSESFVSIGYIGFGVNNASTLFTIPQVE